MPQHSFKYRSDLYDPTMPDANSVMASLLCVTTIYATRPSYELATMALNLAETFTAPEYAETELLCEVSRHVHQQWNEVVRTYADLADNITPLHANLSARR